MNDESPAIAELKGELTRLKDQSESLRQDLRESRAAFSALRESEERYRQIFEIAGEGIMIIRKNRVVLANHALARMLDVPLEAIITRRFDSFVHPDDRSFVLDRYVKRVRGEEAETDYDFRIIQSTGNERWAHISSRIIQWEGNPASLHFVMDVTERKSAEQRLEKAMADLSKSEERYRNILNTMQEAYYEVDLEGNFTFFNMTVPINLGHSRDEIEGLNFRNIASEDDVLKIKKIFNQVYRTGEPVPGFDWEIMRKDGRTIPVETSVSLKRDVLGKVVGFTGVTRNVSERKKAEEELRYLTFHDALTGVYNRRMFEEELERIGSGRFDPIAIVICDLDGLKPINDTLGHAAGDQHIIAAAGLLKKHFRSSDVVARIGGDEFCVLLPHCDPDNLATICDRLKQSLGQFVKGTDVPLLMSIGYAVRRNQGKTVARLMREADKHMYREKEKNREKVQSILQSSLGTT